MLSKKILLLSIAGLLVVTGSCSDSDGKNFVFSFTADPYHTLSSAATTTVIVIPSYNDTVCSFKYTQTSDSKVVELQEMALFEGTNEFTLDITQVLLTTSYFTNDINDNKAKDFRIFGTCTETVKMIGRISDPLNAWGDLFLIPSIENAGLEYFVSLPASTEYKKGSLTILPTTQTTTPISIIVTSYISGSLESNITVEYDGAIGTEQHYMSMYINNNQNSNVTVQLISNVNIMVVMTVPFVSVSNTDKLCGESCLEDYAAFMLVPAPRKVCGTFLLPPDVRMATNDFTTRLYVSPPNVDMDCNVVSKISIFDDGSNSRGVEQIVDSLGNTAVSLTSVDQIGFSSYGGQLSSYRLGSIVESDGITSYGHFLNYVPSTEEWTTGKSQFFTLAKNCYLEFYGDADGSNIALIKIDGLALNTLKFSQTSLPFFNNKYTQFIVKIKGYGVHTIENNGNYVGYVVCKNVNGSYDAAGYLIQFNRRKAKTFF